MSEMTETLDLILTITRKNRGHFQFTDDGNVYFSWTNVGGELQVRRTSGDDGCGLVCACGNRAEVNLVDGKLYLIEADT